MQQSTSPSKIILLAIEGIRHNNKFSQKINYHLNTIKSLFQSSEKLIDESNAIELLQQPFLSLLSDIIVNNNDNNLFFIYSGEILYNLTRILYSHSNQKYKEDLLRTFSLFLEHICKYNLPYIGLFIDSYRYFINDSFQNKQLMSLLNLICEYISSSPSLSLEESEYGLIELIQQIVSMKEFIKIMDKEMKVIIVKSINIVLLHSLHNKTAMSCLNIIDIMLLYSECKEYYKEINSIVFIFNIMCKFPNDNLLSFRLCSVLMIIIEPNELSFLLTILQKSDYYFSIESNGNDLYDINNIMMRNKDDNEISNEIKTVIFNQNEKYLLSFKSNIIKLAIVSFKESKFCVLINSCLIKSFLDKLIDDIDSFYLNKKSSDINYNECIVLNKIILEMTLIQSCIRNKAFEDIKTDQNESNLIQNIIYCLFKCLRIVISNEEIVGEILFDLLHIMKDNQHYLEDIIKNEDYSISTVEIGNTLTDLLSMYYSKEVVYNLISSVSISCIIPSITQSDVNSLYNTDIEMLSQEINAYAFNQNEETKTNIKLLITKACVKLLLKQQNVSPKFIRIVFNENSDQSYISVCSIIVNLINTRNYVSKDKVLIDHLITMFFSGISNISFGDEASFKIKQMVLLELVSKIDINTYFIQCLARIISIRHKGEDKMNELKDLLLNEILAHKVFQYFNSLQHNRIDDNDLKNILFVINTLISFSSENQDIKIAMFLRENGIINIINSCIKNNYDSDNEQLFIRIIQKISSNKYFKESVIIYQNKTILQNVLLSYNEIQISNGINETIYLELMIYLKKVLKLTEISAVCEETRIIPHLIKELKAITTMNNGKSNEILTIMIDILGILSLNSNLLHYLIDNEVVNAINMILSQMINDKQYNGNLFYSIVTIMNSLIKNRDLIGDLYYSTKWKTSLQKIKETIALFVDKLEDMVKVIDYCSNVIIFEKEKNCKNKIFDIAYFQELETIIEGIDSLKNQNGFIKELINKSIKLIIDPNFRIFKLDTIEERTFLQKQIIIATKRQRNRKAIYKKALPSQLSNKRRSQMNINELYYNDNDDTTGNNNEGKIEYLSDHMQYRKHKQSIDFSNSTYIEPHLNHVCIQILNCIEMIANKAQFNKELYDDCNELSELLCLLIVFVKKIESTIEKIYENGIISKLLPLLDNADIYLQTKNQFLKLIDIIITKSKTNNKLIEDPAICNYFTKEMSSISTYNSTYYSPKFIRRKVQVVTKIMLILSHDKSFLKSNPDIFSVEKIIKDSIIFITSKAIISNLCSILRNSLLVSFDDNISKYSTELGEIILLAWNTYPNDQSILSQLYSIINIAYNQPNFINVLTDNVNIEQLTSVFNTNSFDINSFHQFLIMINSLISHKPFGDKLVNEGFIKRIIEIAHGNIFNMTITEQVLLFFVNSIQYNQALGKLISDNPICELSIKVMDRYKITCHKHIIKLTMKLVQALVNNNNDAKCIQYFLKEEIFDMIIKTINLNENINILDLTQTGLKLLIKIATIIIKEDNQNNNSRISLSQPSISILKPSKIIEYNDHDTKNSVLSRTQTRQCSIIISSDNGNNFNEDINHLIIYNRITRHSIRNYKCFIEIISKVLNLYSDNIDIMTLVYELVENVGALSSDINVKLSLINIMIYQGLILTDKQQINSLTLVIETLIVLIINDNCDTNSQKREGYLDGSSFLQLINDIFKLINCSESFVLLILKLLYNVVKEDKINKSFIIKEIHKCLSFIKDEPKFQSGNIIAKIGQILSLLCELTQSKDIPDQFVLFFLQFLLDHDINKYIDMHSAIIEDVKTIVNYISIDSANTAISIRDLIIKLYKVYLDKKESKCLIKIFQIISLICFQSDLVRKSFNDIDFSEELNEKITNNVFSEELVEYQAKGCLLNINQKKDQNDITPTIAKVRLMKKKIIVNQIEDNVRQFLETSRLIKLYQSDGEQIKSYIQMNTSLDKITSVIHKGNTFIIKEEMNLSEMDYCVRSASTAAFKKAKGFFTKKPKPLKCFSILGRKILNKRHQSFNVECNNEEECIAYVDYISLLINNYKSLEENINENDQI